MCSEHAELYHYAVLHGLVLYWLSEERSALYVHAVHISPEKQASCSCNRHWLGGVIMYEEGNVFEDWV